MKLFMLVKAWYFSGGGTSVGLEQSRQRTNTMADRAKLVAHAKQDILEGNAKCSCDWEHLKRALEKGLGLIEGSLIETSAPCAAVSCAWRVMGTIQHRARSQQCNLVDYLLYRTWHLGQDSSHLTTEQSSSPEPIA